MDLTFDYVKRLSLLTPVLLILAIFLIGGGHGWYGPAILLFPCGFIGILNSRSIELPFILLAILQYPIYGLLIDTIGNRKSFKWTLICIVTTHLMLAASILIFRGENWR